MKRLLWLLAFMTMAMMLSAQTLDWVWATQTGSDGNDYGGDIAKDINGNTYITAYFTGSINYGNTNLVSAGERDVLIAKQNPAGEVLWVRQAGGYDHDMSCGIVVDLAGNCFVVGSFEGESNFGTTVLSSSGINDVFITKLDTNGTFLWAKQAGGNELDIAFKVAVDVAGNSYVTGYFGGTAQFGGTTLTTTATYTPFVTKLDPEGNFLWAKQTGGNGAGIGECIARDNQGNFILSGCFTRTVEFDNYTLTTSNYFDIYVAKMNANGDFLWARRAGGASYDYGFSVLSDAMGQYYLTGSFYGPAQFENITLTGSSENANMFIAKLDNSGHFLWARQGLATNESDASDIDIAGNGYCYITGKFSGTFILGDCTLSNSATTEAGFVAKLDNGGNFVWAKQVEGSGNSFIYHAVCQDNNDVRVIGYFDGTIDLDNINLISNGGKDIFIAKLGDAQALPPDNPSSNTQSVLLTASPNPFKHKVTVTFILPEGGMSDVCVFNIRGQKVKTLTSQLMDKGEHSFTWDGRDSNNNSIAAGIYYIKVQNGKHESVKKVLRY